MKKILCILFLTVITNFVYAKKIELIQDTVMWRPSNLPGYQLTLQNCSACHSAHYAEYQPPNSGKGYWEATVNKMKKVFNAPVANENMPAIIEYLSATYGVNRK